jgi:hypothetical protein
LFASVEANDSMLKSRINSSFFNEFPLFGYINFSTIKRDISFLYVF